jgi:hypothetical protein
MNPYLMESMLVALGSHRTTTGDLASTQKVIEHYTRNSQRGTEMGKCNVRVSFNGMAVQRNKFTTNEIWNETIAPQHSLRKNVSFGSCESCGL